MALTLKSDGLGTANKFTHDWVDDFTNLLTGAMNDQAVTLNYRPGSNTGLGTLLLKTDGNNALLKAFKSDNTTSAAMIDASGNLTLAGSASSAGFSLARLRPHGTGATAGVNIWIAPTGSDPAAGDGLQEGDLVFSY